MVVPRDYLIECPYCFARTTAEVKSHYDSDDPWEPFLYVIASCHSCGETMFMRHEIMEKNPRGHGAILWPEGERILNSTIPESLRQEHSEARTCLRYGAYTASVVMVRRTLEAVCAEHGTKGVHLVKALEVMKGKGLIEGRLLEWAQELRVLGNEGAHFTGRRVIRQDAEDALALAEAILDYLYVFSATFDEFKNRRRPSAPGSKPDG